MYSNANRADEHYAPRTERHWPAGARLYLLRWFRQPWCQAIQVPCVKRRHGIPPVNSDQSGCDRLSGNSILKTLIPSKLEFEWQLSVASFIWTYDRHGHTAAPRQCRPTVWSIFGHPMKTFGQVRVQLRNVKSCFRLQLRAIAEPAVLIEAVFDLVWPQFSTGMCRRKQTPSRRAPRS